MEIQMKVVRQFASHVLILMLSLSITLFHSVSTVKAASIDSGTVMSLTCTSADFSPAEVDVIHYDRDTTGEGSETVRLTITDGDGNTVFDAEEAEPVGFAQGFVASYPFTSAPVANPISARLYSPAGNSL